MGPRRLDHPTLPRTWEGSSHQSPELRTSYHCKGRGVRTPSTTVAVTGVSWPWGGHHRGALAMGWPSLGVSWPWGGHLWGALATGWPSLGCRGHHWGVVAVGWLTSEALWPRGDRHRGVVAMGWPSPGCRDHHWGCPGHGVAIIGGVLATGWPSPGGVPLPGGPAGATDLS